MAVSDGGFTVADFAGFEVSGFSEGGVAGAVLLVFGGTHKAGNHD